MLAPPTTRRVAIRVLIRVPSIDPALLARRFPGYKVAILGDAKEKEWIGHWRQGDVEGLAWVPTSLQANAAPGDLLAFPEIVDARLDVDDATRLGM